MSELFFKAMPEERAEQLWQRWQEKIKANHGRHVRVAAQQELYLYGQWKNKRIDSDNVSWQDFYEEVRFGFRDRDGSKRVVLPAGLMGKTLDDVREETRASEISVYF